MIPCIIIDDEPHVIELLQSYVEQVPFLKLEKTFTNPIEALSFMTKVDIGLVFLDIHMEPFSGLDFIKATNSNAAIIMVTAYADYALDGYENDVIDYLLKPVSIARFIKAAQKALNIISSRMIEKTSINNIEGHIFVKAEQKGKFIKIDYKNIDYIEGLKNYVSIYHNKTRTVTLLNIRDLEKRLSTEGFLRVHKSFIVSIEKVDYIEGNMLKVTNAEKLIPIGETFKPILFEKLKLDSLGRRS